MNLLIQDAPHVFSPCLAKEIGLHECLMLQQLHWLIQNNNCKYHDRHFWWKHTNTQWIDTLPYFQNEKRVLKTVKSLRSQNLLITETLSWKIEKIRGDRTLWYRVNYQEVERLSKRIESENLQKKIDKAKAKNKPTTRVDTGSSQNGSMGSSQNGSMIKKIYKEDLLSKSVNTARARENSADESENKNSTNRFFTSDRRRMADRTWVELQAAGLCPGREQYAQLKIMEYTERFPDSSSVADCFSYVMIALEHKHSLTGS